MNPQILRSDIQKIHSYQPGLPIEEVRRKLGIRDIIKLASNENALGPSPKALRALKVAMTKLHRYPEGSCFYLKKKLAARLKVKEANILFGNGSDELIDIILKTINWEQGSEILTADVTFIEYKISAAINRFRVQEVGLNNFGFDLNRILSRISEKTKAIFIANPNNPTGSYLKHKDILSFLNSVPEHVLIVFDEAYFEYVDKKDYANLIKLINRFNIVLLRTFSKIYGLAGLRVGYMVAADKFIGSSERIRQPFNVNSLAQAGALAALEDKAFLNKTLRLMKTEKEYLYKAFLRLGIWFKETSTNFIFIRVDSNANRLFKALLKKGVIIRPMSQYGLTSFARVTIGTRKENLRLVRTLETLLSCQERSKR